MSRSILVLMVSCCPFGVDKVTGGKARLHRLHLESVVFWTEFEKLISLFAALADYHRL